MSIQVTAKIRIDQPVGEVFEALVDPAKISNYWWSSVSARWEEGKTIGLRYDEYNAQGDLYVAEVQPNQRIRFEWGAQGSGHLVTMTLTPMDPASTLLEVTQTGWQGDEADLTSQLLDNKEGWVYMLTCLKAYLDFGVTHLRAALVK